MGHSVADRAFAGIAARISSGQYPVGSMLPSCRKMSTELGINKNTVNKVYGMLRDAGLVISVAGQGMRVVAKPATDQGRFLADLYTDIDAIVQRSRAMGLASAQVESAFRQALVKWYESVRVTMALIECNPWDASSLAAHVQKEMPVSVTPMVLEDFMSDPQAVREQHDMIVTTFQHFAEVNAALADEAKVVALQDKPSIQSLLAISKIPKGMRIGVVAGHERTVRTLQELMRSCGHGVHGRAPRETR